MGLKTCENMIFDGQVAICAVAAFKTSVKMSLKSKN
jgi:hypothetical protein